MKVAHKELRSTPEGCYSKVIGKQMMEQSAAEAMKEKLSSGSETKRSEKNEKVSSSPSRLQSYSQTPPYWSEGRVLKVGFLLVFVRAFARIILKTFGLFTPVVFFMICMIFGGVTLSVLEGTSKNMENLESFENSAREKTEKIAPVGK
jgi:hypothetical protein